ncbi:MAG: hypothetical protein AAGF73_11125 [Actinomycetota bacterium]
MKDDLARRALANTLGWNAFDVATRGAELQALAALKYDEYEGYWPGEGFLEHLVSWLGQMDDADRRRAIEFVRNELVFISRAELDHLIETVYPDHVRPLLIQRAADKLGLPSWRVREITTSRAFHEVQRKTLVLGLADGSRIDRLRRTSGFSHEQFYLAPELSEAWADRMATTLREAVGDETALFEQVLLVDDFAGSGTTSLRKIGETWKGRFERTNVHLQQIAGRAVVEAPTVWVLFYVASAQARTNLHAALIERGLPWELHVVQQLTPELVVCDDELLDMCRRYFDDANFDVLGAHVKEASGDIRLGFGDGRLPLVITHNTPNNSISLLWADTMGRSGSTNQRALFPRRHRHNAERP